MGADETELLKLALAAHQSRSATTLPATSARAEEHGGQRYVVLRDLDGVVAVYRVGKDRSLKGLRRWPATIGMDPREAAFVPRRPSRSALIS